MEKVSRGNIEMSWDPEARLAFLSFKEKTRATGPDAEALVSALTVWIGSEGKPFGLLGDGSKLGAVDAEYRAIWGQFFRKHRDDSFIAFFNMNAIVRVAADMFGIGIGLRLKGFAREQEARDWLRKNGIPA